MSVTLNISGKIFKVSREVISKSQLFDGMLTDCVIENEIVIDRSTKLFKHVYAFLLDDKYPYPRKYYSELDYYLVPYDIDLLYDPNKKCMKDYNKRILKIENMLGVAFIKTVIEKDSVDKCRFPNCNRTCTYYGRCYLHKNDCCHHMKKDSQDDDEVEWCENEIYEDGAYCKDHISDYLK
jgi:hypothetical protein